MNLSNRYKNFHNLGGGNLYRFLDKNKFSKSNSIRFFKFNFATAYEKNNKCWAIELRNI